MVLMALFSMRVLVALPSAGEFGLGSCSRPFGLWLGPPRTFIKCVNFKVSLPLFPNDNSYDVQWQCILLTLSTNASKQFLKHRLWELEMFLELPNLQPTEFGPRTP